MNPDASVGFVGTMAESSTSGSPRVTGYSIRLDDERPGMQLRSAKRQRLQTGVAIPSTPQNSVSLASTPDLEMSHHIHVRTLEQSQRDLETLEGLEFIPETQFGEEEDIEEEDRQEAHKKHKWSPDDLKHEFDVQMKDPPLYYLETCSDKPSIGPPVHEWLRTLCADGSGMGPAPFHMLQLTSDAQKYIGQCTNDDETDQWSREIDRIWYPQSRASKPQERRYADSKRHIAGRKGYTLQRYQTRRDRITIWIDNRLQAAKLAIEDGEGLFPSTSPQVNIGYSIKAIRRLRQHKSHSNSNYLMNLVESLVYHRYGPKIEIRQLILASCWDPAHPWFGEIAVTDLVQGYTGSGHGFSFCAAGLSNCSMHQSISNQDMTRVIQRLQPDGNSIVDVINDGKTEQHCVLSAAVAEQDVGSRDIWGICSQVDLCTYIIDSLKI